MTSSPERTEVPLEKVSSVPPPPSSWMSFGPLPVAEPRSRRGRGKDFATVEVAKLAREEPGRDAEEAPTSSGAEPEHLGSAALFAWGRQDSSPLQPKAPKQQAAPPSQPPGNEAGCPSGEKAANEARQQLARVARALDRALSAFWDSCGRRVSVAEHWGQFFTEVAIDLGKGASSAGYLTQEELEDAMRARFPASSAGGEDLVATGVTAADFRAIFAAADSSRLGRITPREWQLKLYRLEFDWREEPSQLSQASQPGSQASQEQPDELPSSSQQAAQQQSSTAQSSAAPQQRSVAPQQSSAALQQSSAAQQQSSVAQQSSVVETAAAQAAQVSRSCAAASPSSPSRPSVSVPEDCPSPVKEAVLPCPEPRQRGSKRKVDTEDSTAAPKAASKKASKGTGAEADEAGPDAQAKKRLRRFSPEATKASAAEDPETPVTAGSKKRLASAASSAKVPKKKASQVLEKPKSNGAASSSTAPASSASSSTAPASSSSGSAMGCARASSSIAILEGHTTRPTELGCRVRVQGDGWGSGKGFFQAVITEADDMTFTVIKTGTAKNKNAWEETHVLKEYCQLLENKVPPQKQPKNMQPKHKQLRLRKKPAAGRPSKRKA